MKSACAKIKHRNDDVTRRRELMSDRLPGHYFTLIVVALAAVGTMELAWAAEDAPVWTLRVDLSWVDPSGDFVATSVDDGTVATSFDAGFGGGLRGEYHFSERFGVELGVLSAGSVDITTGVSGGTVGSSLELSSFTPFTVGLNVHLTPDHPLDLYAGPLIALVRYEDVEIRAAIGTAGTNVSVDNDVGWGGIIGLDLPLGERGWLVQANLRYIESDMKDSGGAVSIDSQFDPVIFSIGFGYRF